MREIESENDRKALRNANQAVTSLQNAEAKRQEKLASTPRKKISRRNLKGIFSQDHSRFE